MAFITGDVVPDPRDSSFFRVVFKRGSETLGEWTVSSELEGKAQIIVALNEVLKRNNRHRKPK